LWTTKYCISCDQASAHRAGIKTQNSLSSFFRETNSQRPFLKWFYFRVIISRDDVIHRGFFCLCRFLVDRTSKDFFILQGSWYNKIHVQLIQIDVFDVFTDIETKDWLLPQNLFLTWGAERTLRKCGNSIFILLRKTGSINYFHLMTMIRAIFPWDCIILFFLTFQHLSIRLVQSWPTN